MNLPICFSFQGYMMTNSHTTSLKEVIPYRKLHKSTYGFIKKYLTDVSNDLDIPF